MPRSWRPYRHLLASVLLLQALLFTGGCGYHLLGASSEAPPHFSVAVPVFRNLTYRAAAEGEFAEAVVQALLRHGVRVRGAEVADYLVSGEIISLADLGEAYSASDKAVLYRAEVEVALTIRNRHTSEIVVQERLRRRISYPAQSQRALQPSVDSAARQELAEQVAQTVLVRLLTMPAGGGRP